MILGTKENVEKPKNWVKTDPHYHSFSRNKVLVAAIKKYGKADMKVFWSCPILLNFYVCPNILSMTIFLKKVLFITRPIPLQTSV